MRLHVSAFKKVCAFEATAELADSPCSQVVRGIYDKMQAERCTDWGIWRCAQTYLGACAAAICKSAYSIAEARTL